MPDKKCVVSFADGVGNYAKALMRLEQSLKQVGYGGENERVKLINDYGHIGSPFHKGTPDAVPYAFKAYSIKKAMDEDMRYILWVDSCVYATKSINPVFDHIKEHGYLLFNNIGFSVGDYTSDACIAKWGISRYDAFNIPMLMACVLGFDVEHPVARNFLKWYIDAAADGVSYQGDWNNQYLQVSQDMRVKGHRHDQSCASILANKLGMTITNAQSTYFAYAEHKGKIPIANTVCLWSEGIL